MKYGNFGSVLKDIIDFTEVKYIRIATALEYDSSYISKWCNNKRLPPLNNSKYIIQKLSKLFSEEINSNGNVEVFNKIFDINTNNKSEEHLIDNIGELLTNSYLKSINNNAEVSTSNNVKFINNKLIDFIYETIDNIVNETNENIEIICTDNIFSQFHDKLKKNLKDNNIKNIEINFKLGVENEKIEDIEYLRKTWDLMSDMINCNISIYNNWTFRNLNRLIVKGKFAIIYSFNQDSNYGTGFYITDYKSVEELYNDTIYYFTRNNMLIEPLSGENLDNLDYILDFYSGNNFNLILNDGFSLFLTIDVINNLINEKKEVLRERVVKTLEKSEIMMKEFFIPENKINIIIFKSKLIEYIKKGEITIGGIEYTLSWEEREMHIKNIVDKLRNYENVNIVLIDDILLSFEIDNFFKVSLFCSEDKAFLLNGGKNNKTLYYKILDKNLIDFININMDKRKETNSFIDCCDKEYIIKFIFDRFNVYKKLSSIV